LAIAQPISDHTIPGQRPADRHAVALWLFVCCAMIFAMVVIGGITRLTESGLSIVEWQPIGGAVPPLSHADWQHLFDEYRASPQYHLLNQGMDLAGFQTIFWWEYVHRLWGRLIGFVFLVPLVWLAITGRMARGMILPLSGFFLLGAVQGAIGWWMVASGLDAGPFVSPYRLSFHLGFALALYGAMLWVALDLWRAPAPPAPPSLRRAALLLLALVFVTLLAGGFVAGSHAGLIYNEFPAMGDRLVPPDYRNPALSWWRNAFETPAAIQLHHRILAITTLCAVLAFSAWIARRAKWARGEAAALALVGLAQVALGIATLLLHVPIALAMAHQAGAATLLTLTVIAAQVLHRRA
jgi:cytochrome c oxidase assembly protein subunit 15